ncbi:papain-like cysteine protease family protein [Roseomonas harenae]|uniref:papain-like cysteine protease family protein n=1 Tax=Muricoccus harenae TaxID=2692566 RepID=UPI0013319712|nr:papain-like cysteine protease family protein [Roseomonas harenae]
MSVYLDVPYVSQLNFGGGLNDPTGCWYCSAMMLAYHFEAGPRLGVPEFYGPSGHMATGSSGTAQTAARAALAAKGFINEHEALATREHLASVPECQTNKTFSVSELEILLRRAGPIFFYWMKTSKASGATYGHASVMIGTEDSGSQIIYHDPEGEASIGVFRNARMPVATFHQLRQKWKYAMMQREGVISSMVRIKP